MPTRKLTHADWVAEGNRLYGEDALKWAFRCPVCGHVATVQEWKDAGAPDGGIAFSCIGRWKDGGREAFSVGQETPCNYAGGGLLRLNPVHVDRDGEVHQVFEFAANPVRAA